MTVLPGSLDYLYYNGIFDHIPYEAYEPLPVNTGVDIMQSIGNTGLQAGNPYSSYNYTQGYANNGLKYMDTAMSGNAYSAYNTSKDTFSKESLTGEDYSLNRAAFGVDNGIGDNSDIVAQTYGADGKSLKDSIAQSVESTKNKILNINPVLKGIIGAAILTGTVFMIFRGKKKP